MQDYQTLVEHAPSSMSDASASRVLVVSSTFPSAIQPVHGVFVKERMRNVALLPQYQLDVVAPTPYFPPLKTFSRWYSFSQLPRRENVDGLQVVRPRYPLPPKVGGFFHPQLMAGAVRRGANQFGGAHQYDLIDAHFIYPDGAAAAYLSRKTGLPLVITCRGEDILTIPDLPLCRGPVCFALQQATKLVALSGQIRDRMLELGADEKKIEVIPNGVAVDKFFPVGRTKARQLCDLPQDRPIIVSVGYRLERKGFHLLIEAASHLLADQPDLLVVIVGGPARWGQDYSDMIEQTIDRFGMRGHVLLTGAKSQSELANWYSSADLFALITSREGSPNVLMEALACGTPAVATPIGGIPDVLSDKDLGILLPERSVEATTNGLRTAMARQWDRNQIRRIMEKKSWKYTAGQVDSVFRSALGNSGA